MGVFQASSRSWNGGYRDSCLGKGGIYEDKKRRQGVSGEWRVGFVLTSSSADR
jgi:hypothetical protein